MFTKVIVIGMNPSALPADEKIRKNHTIDRLFKWMSQCGVDYFSFTNCAHEPGRVKFKNVDYEFLLTNIQGYNKIIALGGFASDVLKRIGINHFKLPHPSPRNRALNDKSYEKTVLKECEQYIWDVA